MKLFTDSGYTKWHIVDAIEDIEYGRHSFKGKMVTTACGASTRLSLSGRLIEMDSGEVTSNSICKKCSKEKNSYPAIETMDLYEQLHSLKQWSLVYAGTNEDKICNYLQRKGWHSYPSKHGTVPVGRVMFLDVTIGSKTIGYYNQEYYIVSIDDFVSTGLKYVFFTKLS